MSVLPMVQRQLRVACRQRRSYWVRLASAAVAMTLLAITVVVRRVQWYWSGPETFQLLAWFGFLYCLVSGGLSTADCLSMERRENTLGLLFLTDLKGYDVALGKFCASCIPSYLGLLAILPVLAVPVLMGGVLYSDFWRVSLSLSVTLLFAMSLGLLVSVCSRNAFRATTITILLLGWLSFAMPLLGEMVRRFPRWRTLTTVATWVSPFYTQFMAFSTNGRFGSQTFWDSALAVTGLSLLAIGVTCLVVPHSWRERAGNEAAWRRWLRDLRGGQIGTRAARSNFRRALLDKNPFAWLTSRGTVSSTGLLVVATLVVAGTAWIASIAFGRIPTPNVEDQLFFWSCAVIALHCLVLGKASTAPSERFAEDLQTGGLELLLCTPLSVSELLRGQRQAWRRQLIGAALITLMIHGVVIYLCLTELSSENNAGPSMSYLLRASARNLISVVPSSPWEQTVMIVFLFLGAALMVLHWVTLNWTSAWLSMRFRQPRFAPWVAIALVAIPPWIAFLGCILGMLEVQATWSAARATFFNFKLALALHVLNDALLIRWARGHLLRDFRAAAARLYVSPRPIKYYLRPAMVAAACGVLLTLFHWEENRRGKNAWDALTAELNRRGERLERVPLSTRRVSPQENFASVPLVAEIFSPPMNPSARALAVTRGTANRSVPLRTITLYLNGQPRGYPPWDEERSWAHQKRTDLNRWLSESQTMGLVPTNSGPTTASSVLLSALEPFTASLETLRRASERPACAYPLGNSVDWNASPPHLQVLGDLSEVLRYRASAELLEGGFEQAFADVNLCVYLAETLAHDPVWQSHAFRAQLLAAALQPLWEGLSEHCWPEADLVAFEGRLSGLDVLEAQPCLMHAAMLNELDAWARNRDNRARNGGLRCFGRVFSPQGWTYLNAVNVYRWYQKDLAGLVDPAEGRIYPKRIIEASRSRWNQVSSAGGFDSMLWQVTRPAGRTQVAITQAVVACALERYRIHHAEYPESLQALVPEFLDKVPHDIVDGAPLRYRRLGESNFVLYSVGWNGQDDGGASKNNLDWVWKYR